jgi:hypothetical protein
MEIGLKNRSYPDTMWHPMDGDRRAETSKQERRLT